MSLGRLHELCSARRISRRGWVQRAAVVAVTPGGGLKGVVSLFLQTPPHLPRNAVRRACVQCAQTTIANPGRKGDIQLDGD